MESPGASRKQLDALFCWLRVWDQVGTIRRVCGFWGVWRLRGVCARLLVGVRIWKSGNLHLGFVIAPLFERFQNGVRGLGWAGPAPI